MVCDESGINIISLLFRILEFENDVVITALFAALESIRAAVESAVDEIGIPFSNCII